MDWFVKAFMKASVTWLAAGVTLGVVMAARPSLAIYRTAHFHMLLLGFVAMMIFGVAYHVIPRFTGHPLHSSGAAGVHWWLANVGLMLMVAGFICRAHGVRFAPTLLATGGVFVATGAYTFAYLIWRTIDGPRPKPASASGRRPLTTL